MTPFASIPALALIAALAACAADRPAPELADFKANRAIVRSEAGQQRYLDLYRRACVEVAPDFAKTVPVLEGAGFLQSDGPRPHSIGGGTWSDGTAHARIALGPDGDVSCTVSFKAPPSDVLVQGLAEIVRGSTIGRDAVPMRRSILGEGFIVEGPRQVVFAVGPRRRSSSEPTRISLHYFN